MSTYLFRNPKANYKLAAFNRRMDRMNNYPLIILFSFVLGFIACKAETSLPKLRAISTEIERFTDGLHKESVRSTSKPTYMYKAH